jgi:NADH-quinone oxidoreductase subunit A
VPQAAITFSAEAAVVSAAAEKLALTSIADIGVFFGVLLVGFAYVWKRGDLDWVRAVTRNRPQVVHRSPPTRALERSQSILTA